MNFHRELIERTTALDIRIKTTTFKIDFATSNFRPWKGKVLAKVKVKFTELKEKNKSKQAKQKPVSCDQDAKKMHLKELHQKYVIVTENKASNNFA